MISLKTNRFPALVSLPMLGTLAILAGLGSSDARDVSLPETVTIEAGSFQYRSSGEYLEGGHAVDAPMAEVTFDRPFEIMKYQVTVGDYERCVAQAVCEPRLNQGLDAANLPVTGVSHADATTYAKWFERQTGRSWRLPTDEEWAYAAGGRFVDDAVNADRDPENPAARWLAMYQKFADLETGADPVLKPAGAYGTNERGVFDMSGNVWEWTDSCYRRSRIEPDGSETLIANNCGVRIAAGQHRSYVTFFIQDAKGGGCMVGAAPDYLGFRLVAGTPVGPIRRLLNNLGWHQRS